MADNEILQAEQEPAEEAAPKAEKKNKKEKPKKTLKQEIIEWVLVFVAALVIATVCRTFIFEFVRVDGNSMYPTLKDGEFMFVSKWEYTMGGDPELFDVVICHYPNRGNTNFVKRVVGCPGDTVEIRGGYLIVNGRIYAEKYLSERTASNFGPYTVGEGEYLLFGDNRNNSNDSRNSAVGALPRDMIKGHVLSVLWHEIPSTLEDSY